MRKPIIQTLFFLLLISILIIPSCSPDSPSYEELADTLHSLKPYEQIYADNNDTDYYHFQEEVGLRAADSEKTPFEVDALNELLLNEEFLAVYVEKYGLYDLLEHYNVYLVNTEVLGDYNTDVYTRDYVTEIKSRNEMVFNSITSLPEYKSLGSYVFDKDEMEKLHGSSGYYNGRKDEVIEGETVSGEFNDELNDNAVYTSSRTNKSEKKYYGDWAVEYNVKYDYNAGQYGWNNGSFEDVSPSWEETKELIVYYKDIVVLRDNTTPNMINIRFPIIDNKIIYWYQEYDALYDNYDIAGLLLNGNDTSTQIGKKPSDGEYDISTVKDEISKKSVGDVCTFGSYEQDNNSSNRKEDIEWIVLERDGDKVLLISKYALDAQPYNTVDENITWETCSLRKWLNETFISNAFTDEAQGMIQSTTVTADKNPKYDTPPGNQTNDKIFLLSIEEAEKYFGSDNARSCKGTAYCLAQGASEGAAFMWWLRTPGTRADNAALVGNDGDIFDTGLGVYWERYAVRPVMWVNVGE